MSDWKIAKKGAGCSVCSKDFPVGEEFVSAIFPMPEDAPGMFERIDACEACFAGLEREPYSRWTTRRPAETSKDPILDLMLAREFLVRLAREGDPERGGLLFLLALLLVRKRRIKLLGERHEEGGPMMDFLVKTEEGEVEVAVPARDLSPEEQSELEGELARLFGLGGQKEDETGPSGLT